MKTLYFFIGLPCSGKSYAAKLIVNKVFGDTGVYISTGDIARSLSTTQELKDKTSELDLFPGEQELRSKLLELIESTTATNVIVDGFPRFDGQVDFIVDNLWIYHPKVIDINAGDVSTLAARARNRARDQRDLDEFRSRLSKASLNMSSVYEALNRRLLSFYTIMSGDDEYMIREFKRMFGVK